MAATYVTVAELKANLGIQNLYSDTIVEEVCQSAEDIVKAYLWFDTYPVAGAGLYSNSAVLVLSSPTSFVTGQSVTISNCGTSFNGTYTITGTYPYTYGSINFPYFTNFPYSVYQWPRGYSMISFAKTAADENYHQIQPYGKAEGPDTKSVGYASTPLVREASLMVATDIWQARQSSMNGGIAPDGSMGGSPWRMSASLMAKVRGLLTPYLTPKSMVG